MKNYHSISAYIPELHKRQSMRLKGYDYAKSGLYFITINCFDKNLFFGEIKNGEMNLNDAGEIANKCWLEIPNHFPKVVLHEYVIMPNHIHGIIEIDNNEIKKNQKPSRVHFVLKSALVFYMFLYTLGYNQRITLVRQQ